jgi:hypothetical protein
MLYECDWQAADAYTYLDFLGSTAFAWEFLRRNSDYQAAYRAIASAGDTTPETSEQVAQQWGLHFMADPDLRTDRAHVAWLWHLNPATVIVAPAPDEFTETLSINELTPTFSRRTADGEHWILGQGGDALQVALIDGANTARSAAVVIPFDNCPEIRLKAALRFCEAITTGHVSGPTPDGLTAQQRNRLKLILRVLDGKFAGCSYRTIAEGLFERSSVPAAREWGDHGLRSRIRRLYRRGLDLVHGQYLDLLVDPQQVHG